MDPLSLVPVQFGHAQHHELEIYRQKKAGGGDGGHH
jgi:hypothetical protein